MSIRVHMKSFFFFKQKTAHEWRISDWSSDVCSSDLMTGRAIALDPAGGNNGWWRIAARDRPKGDRDERYCIARAAACQLHEIGTASRGERVSVRVDLGGRRILNNKTQQAQDP